MLADTAVRTAPDLASALAELAAPAPPTVCVGGTDLIPRLRAGELSVAGVLLCRRLSELAGISHDGGRLRIGAAVTYRQLAESQLIADVVPLLRELAATLANPRVRNRGTIGGQLCAARPRYDILPVLVAVDAVAHVRSAADARTIPVADFVLAERRTALATGELLVEIEIPDVPPADALGFERIGTSQGPVVNVAGCRRRGSIRLVIGAVGARPIVLDLANPPRRDLAPVVEQVQQAAWSDAPGLASAWYRSHVAGVLATRLLTRLAGGGAADD